MFELGFSRNRESTGNGVTIKQFPEYGKTIAVLSGTELNACNILNRIVNNLPEDSSIFMNIDYDDVILRNQYKGVCKVNEKDGDTFNSEYGKDLARAKCMQRYHRDLDPILRKYLTDARKLVAAFEHYMWKHNIDFENVKSVEDMRLYDYGEDKMRDA